MLWLKVGGIALVVIALLAWGIQRYRKYINSDASGNDYQ